MSIVPVNRRGNDVRLGAIALIDILGFKGIWKRYDPDDVLKKLKRLREIGMLHEDQGREYLDEQHKAGAAKYDLSTRFLSDAICVACWFDDGEVRGRSAECSLTYIVAKMALNMIQEAALTDPVLALRGCISVGAFEIDENSLIGPAVDEAAECMNIAEGAFVWLTRSASDCVEEAVRGLKALEESVGHPLDNSFDLSLFRSYEMPVKNSAAQRVPVLNVLAGEPPATQNKIATSIISSFDSARTDVQIKKQNTKSLLEACLGRTL